MATRACWASRPTASTTSGPGCAPACSRRDAIIVSGGVSVGPYDVVRAAFQAYGTIDLWRVAVQPGKPFAFGTAGRRATTAATRTGRPRSCSGCRATRSRRFVTFELFVRPALRRLAGHRDDDRFRPVDRAVLGDDVRKSQGRRAFIRVRAERDATGSPVRDERGRVRVRLAGGAGGQGSHVLSALATADALAVDPRGRRRAAGRLGGRSLVAGPRLTARPAAILDAMDPSPAERTPRAPSVAVCRTSTGPGGRGWSTCRTSP